MLEDCYRLALVSALILSRSFFFPRMIHIRTMMSGKPDALVLIGLVIANAFAQFLSSPSPSPAPPLHSTPEQGSRDRPRRRRIPATLRFRVWETFCGSSFTGDCFACGSQIRFRNFHCGHIIPVCTGGSTTLENLRPLCALCNASMGSENLHSFTQRYLKPIGSKKKAVPPVSTVHSP